ncbi:hypothetical protein [Campylobacter peloridis]|uniref:Sec-independent protein translocase subunit TatA2 n=1 Tax=Campylobacter peloridis TaxID=488546 RepID=A0ABX6TTC0_9BACT|nr:hypothetical protein [Campylobacter peloridis]AJC84932.1 hypothetical protein CPEL_1116 [Campylobacter peloridis LMG 23910]MBX1886425.1 hypothetical protein [Campylobacter peloridis]MBX2078579.1 hypothetical protein [Campylobacter peloridis]QOQ88967.1 hypothetical protein IMC75_00370 [Campylobacter peloridis]
MVFLIPLVLIISSIFLIDHFYFSKENEILKSQNQIEQKHTNKESKQKYIEDILNQK